MAAEQSTLIKRCVYRGQKQLNRFSSYTLSTHVPQVALLCSKAVVLNLGATAPWWALLTFRGAEILKGRNVGHYIQKVLRYFVSGPMYARALYICTRLLA